MYFEDPFYLLKDCVTMGKLGGFLVKLTIYLVFDVLIKTSLTIHSFDSDVRSPLLDGPLFTYGSGSNDTNVFYLFYDFGIVLGLCVGVLLGLY